MILRALCSFLATLLLVSSLSAQEKAERFLFPGTQLSVALLDDNWVPEKDGRRLRAVDGLAWLLIMPFEEYQEAQLQPIINDIVPNGQTDTVMLLDDQGFVVVEGRYVPASDFQYLGKLTNAEGQQVYIAGWVSKESVITPTVMLATLESLQVDKGMPPPFLHKSYWYDESRVPLKYCSESRSPRQTIFTPSGECSPVSPDVSSLVVSGIKDDGVFYEKTIIRNRESYNMQVTGFIETPYGNFRRFESDLNDATGQKLMMYVLNYEGITYMVQSILVADQAVEVEQLDQFVATFKPQ